MKGKLLVLLGSDCTDEQGRFLVDGFAAGNLVDIFAEGGVFPFHLSPCLFCLIPLLFKRGLWSFVQFDVFATLIFAFFCMYVCMYVIF